MLREKRSSVSHFCESVGKAVIVSAIAYSCFVLVASLRKRESEGAYEERLRKAYEGLSPEEY